MNRKEKVIEFFQCLVSRFRDDDVPSLGAQLTYYLILAFFPFLIFLVNIVGIVDMSSEKLINEISNVLPTDTGTAVRDIITEVTLNSNGTLLSFGMLGTIWAASNGVNAIIKGLNKAYDEEETRPFWKVRGLSILSTIVLVLVIIISMVMLVFGKGVGEFLFQWMNYPDGFQLIWNVVKIAIPITALLIVFVLLYTVAPNRRMKWREAIPGSIFTTIGWITTSVLFSFYVNQFGNYTKTYGSLGGVIVLLIWLYLSSIIVLLGGEINATLAFSKEGKVKCGTKRFSFQLPWFNKKKDK